MAYTKSEDLLRRALGRMGVGAARPNPPEGEAPFALMAQFPEPEAPWLEFGRYGSLERALDEALDLRDPDGRRCPALTVVAVREVVSRSARPPWVGELRWLGAVGPDGTVAGESPSPGDEVLLALWESPEADGEEMLRNCDGVDRRLLALAAAACARTALPYFQIAQHRSLAGKLLSAVEAWARGAPAEGVRAARAATDVIRRAQPQAGFSVGAAHSAAVTASIVAAPPPPPVPGAPRTAAEWAALAAGEAGRAAYYAVYYAPPSNGSSEDIEPARAAAAALRRSQAPLVRAAIPLGAVLLASRRRRPIGLPFQSPPARSYSRARTDRRSNPAPQAPEFKLVCLPPDQSKEWIPFDEAESLRGALDAARAPVSRLRMGTVVLVRQHGIQVWAGVMGDDGEVRPLPALPRGSDALDWFGAWWGPAASAAWMLRQSGRVDRRTLVQAACDCAEAGLIYARPRSADARPWEAIETARAWCRGEASPDEVRKAVRGAIDAGAAARRQIAGLAAYGAGHAARVAVTRTAADAGAAAEMACMEPTSLPLPALVRNVIPIGIVMASRLRSQRRS